MPEEGGSDTAIWLLGLGALGVVAGGAFLAARRTRPHGASADRSELALTPKEEFVAVDPAQRFVRADEAAAGEPTPPAPYVEPVIARPDPAPIPAPTVAMDRSREDRSHSTLAEQREAMAATAPSAENPFLTRKNRLRRANFLLSHQRAGDDTGESRAPQSVEAASPQQNERHRSQVSYSFGNGSLKTPVLKPRYN